MSARHIRVAGVAAAILVAACYTSPAPGAMPEARSPYGAPVTVWLADRRQVKGELLELGDTTVTLLSRATGRVAVARWSALRSMEFSVVDAVLFGRGNPNGKALEQARMRARFPYGMSAEVTAALLSKVGQAAPDTLAATAPKR